MTPRISAIAMAAILASLLSVSCVTTRKAPQSAIACPECRVVVTYVENESLPFEGLELVVVDGADAVNYDDFGPTEERRHECPGCEGLLTSLFRRGKLEHRCSICSDSPYTCKVSHPVQYGSGR